MYTYVIICLHVCWGAWDMQCHMMRHCAAPWEPWMPVWLGRVANIYIHPFCIHTLVWGCLKSLNEVPRPMGAVSQLDDSNAKLWDSSKWDACPPWAGWASKKNHIPCFSVGPSFVFPRKDHIVFRYLLLWTVCLPGAEIWHRFVDTKMQWVGP